MVISVKITELGAIVALDDPDLLPVVDITDATTKKVTAAQFRDFVLATLAPATSVVGGTAFGAAPVVGVSLGYARADHSHGTPTDPLPGHLAAPDPHNGYLLANGTRALTNTWNVGGNRITALPTPTSTTDAANKAYVDSKVQGLDWQESVLASQDAPPGLPATGARYLIGTSPSGDWVGHANEIATWNSVAWEFDVPNDGWAVWVEDVDLLRVFNGTAWVSFGSTNDHGALSGLADDDHTQYFLASGARSLTGPLTVSGILAPAVSASSTGRIYFDSALNRFRVSENGVAYADLVLGSSGAVNKVAYWTGTSTLSSSTDFHWDSLDARLGVGDTSPNERVTIGGVLSLGASPDPDNTPGYGKLYANTSADARPYWLDGTGQIFNLTLDRFNTLMYGGAGDVTIDLSPALPVFNTLSLTQDTTFNSPDNPGLGRSASVRLVNDTVTPFTLTFPAGWRWLGIGAPSELLGSSVGYLSLTQYGSGDTDIVAAWAYENEPAVITSKTPITVPPKVANYTVAVTDGTILVDATSTTISIILPPATDNVGSEYVVKKIDQTSNKVLVLPYGTYSDDGPAYQIDGAYVYELLNQYESIKVQCDGTQYWII